MNLTEPNPTGTLVNITSSSIIGPSFETRAAAAAPQPASSLLLPPQASPFSSPQQPQPQTINDIISSITNAVAQSATATSASPAQVLPVAVAVPGISSSPSTIVTISAQQPAPQSQTVYTVYPAPPPPPMSKHSIFYWKIFVHLSTSESIMTVVRVYLGIIILVQENTTPIFDFCINILPLNRMMSFLH